MIPTLYRRLPKVILINVAQNMRIRTAHKKSALLSNMYPNAIYVRECRGAEGTKRKSIRGEQKIHGASDGNRQT